ncbi:uncharacterized protein LOC142333220 [Lycorma delicatula]|uniref:uncharacterized protein LOC142333220 n=1 Tax=Lycorma delicatula TaxID=130591 RepID=UPI003F50EF5F
MSGHIIHDVIAVNCVQNIKKEYLHFLTDIDWNYECLDGITESGTTIYTSELNAKYLRDHCTKHESWFVGLSEGKWHLLATKRKPIKVMTAMSQYSPGSVIFLFQGEFGFVLYTGNCCINIESPTLKVMENVTSKKVLKSIYIDSTNLLSSDSCHNWLTVNDASKQTREIIRKHMNFKIVLASDQLMRSEVIENVIKEFKCHVVVSDRRYSLMKYDEFPYLKSIGYYNNIDRYKTNDKYKVRCDEFIKFENAVLKKKCNEILIYFTDTCINSDLKSTDEDKLINKYAEKNVYLIHLNCHNTKDELKILLQKFYSKTIILLNSFNKQYRNCLLPNLFKRIEKKCVEITDESNATSNNKIHCEEVIGTDKKENKTVSASKPPSDDCNYPLTKKHIICNVEPVELRNYYENTSVRKYNKKDESKVYGDHTYACKNNNIEDKKNEFEKNDEKISRYNNENSFLALSGNKMAEKIDDLKSRQWLKINTEHLYTKKLLDINNSTDKVKQKSITVSNCSSRSMCKKQMIDSCNNNNNNNNNNNSNNDNNNNNNNNNDDKIKKSVLNIYKYSNSDDKKFIWQAVSGGNSDNVLVKYLSSSDLMKSVNSTCKLTKDVFVKIRKIDSSNDIIKMNKSNKLVVKRNEDHKNDYVLNKTNSFIESNIPDLKEKIFDIGNEQLTINEGNNINDDDGGGDNNVNYKQQQFVNNENINLIKANQKCNNNNNNKTVLSNIFLDHTYTTCSSIKSGPKTYIRGNNKINDKEIEKSLIPLCKKIVLKKKLNKKHNKCYKNFSKKQKCKRIKDNKVHYRDKILLDKEFCSFSDQSKQVDLPFKYSSNNVARCALYDIKKSEQLFNQYLNQTQHTNNDFSVLSTSNPVCSTKRMYVNPITVHKTLLPKITIDITSNKKSIENHLINNKNTSEFVSNSSVINDMKYLMNARSDNLLQKSNYDIAIINDKEVNETTSSIVLPCLSDSIKLDENDKISTNNNSLDVTKKTNKRCFCNKVVNPNEKHFCNFNRKNVEKLSTNSYCKRVKFKHMHYNDDKCISSTNDSTVSMKKPVVINDSDKCANNNDISKNLTDKIKELCPFQCFVHLNRIDDKNLFLVNRKNIVKFNNDSKMDVVSIQMESNDNIVPTNNNNNNDNIIVTNDNTKPLTRLEVKLNKKCITIHEPHLINKDDSFLNHDNHSSFIDYKKINTSNSAKISTDESNVVSSKSTDSHLRNKTSDIIDSGKNIIKSNHPLKLYRTLNLQHLPDKMKLKLSHQDCRFKNNRACRISSRLTNSGSAKFIKLSDCVSSSDIKNINSNVIPSLSINGDSEHCLVVKKNDDVFNEMEKRITYKNIAKNDDDVINLIKRDDCKLNINFNELIAPSTSVNLESSLMSPSFDCQHNSDSGTIKKHFINSEIASSLNTLQPSMCYKNICTISDSNINCNNSILHSSNNNNNSVSDSRLLELNVPTMNDSPFSCRNKLKQPILLLTDIIKQANFLLYFNLWPNWMIRSVNKKTKSKSRLCTFNKSYRE